uniref:Uncharacterized protein n=1 Tax=Schlesneria paludicola TaxID=360056 RepID=A0A7C2JZJ6_9PLAN
MHAECDREQIDDAELAKLFEQSFPLKRQPPKNDDRPPPINPYVVIRYDETDIGVRPAPGGAVTYLSPDLLVTNLTGAPDIIVGQPHRLQARLSNFGLFPATLVQVDFYWANPSMAITETSVNFIGSGLLPHLPAGSSSGPSAMVVDCATDWVPVFENGGHECLLARATVPTFDAGPVPLDPGLSYRVGQRNLNVVQVAAGQSFKMFVRAANFARFPLAAQVWGGRMDARQIRQWLAMSRGRSRQAQDFQEGALSWRITADEPPEPLPGPTKLFAERLLAYDDDPRESPPKSQRMWAQELPAMTEQKLTVHAAVPQGARPGAVYSLSLQQQLGPILTGGYGILLVVV